MIDLARELHGIISATGFAPALMTFAARQPLAVEVPVGHDRLGVPILEGGIWPVDGGLVPVFLRPPSKWRNAQEEGDIYVVTMLPMPTTTLRGYEYALKVFPRWGALRCADLRPGGPFSCQRGVWEKVSIVNTYTLMARVVQIHISLLLQLWHGLMDEVNLRHGLTFRPGSLPSISEDTTIAVQFDTRPSVYMLFEPAAKEVNND